MKQTQHKIPRIYMSQSALDLLHKVKEKHGDVMFHISGGCCDGSSPMCFAKGEFLLGTQDIYLGSVEESAFYISRSTFTYYENTYIHIDAVEGRGTSFSLEIPLGYRFILSSTLIEDKDKGFVQQPVNVE